MNPRRTALWAFIVTALALLMVTLDNLVVTTALPVIQESLNATIEQLEWTVNAYTLTFAVLLLTGAALGDRFGRRRMFVIGVTHLHGRLRGRRAGAHHRDAHPGARGPGRRRRDRGAPDPDHPVARACRPIAAASRWAPGVPSAAWPSRSGPLVGGAITEGLSWQWIFWLNVPIGIVLVPLAWSRLNESYGPESRLDLPGLGLASAGLLGIVWGVIHGNEEGWTSPSIILPIGVGFAAPRRVPCLGAPRSGAHGAARGSWPTSRSTAPTSRRC